MAHLIEEAQKHEDSYCKIAFLKNPFAYFGGPPFRSPSIMSKIGMRRLLAGVVLAAGTAMSCIRAGT